MLRKQTSEQEERIQQEKGMEELQFATLIFHIARQGSLHWVPESRAGNSLAPLQTSHCSGLTSLALAHTTHLPLPHLSL